MKGVVAVTFISFDVCMALVLIVIEQHGVSAELPPPLRCAATSLYVQAEVVVVNEPAIFGRNVKHNIVSRWIAFLIVKHGASSGNAVTKQPY